MLLVTINTTTETLQSSRDSDTAKSPQFRTIHMTLVSTVSPGVPLLIAVGVLAGIIATRAMDVVMARLPEGETPPFVASGVLTEQDPETAPGRLAAVVHHVAGWLTGPLFVVLLLFAGSVLGNRLVAYLATALVLFALMVGFFAIVVLPRPGLARQRVQMITRDWAISAAVYLLVLVPLVAGAARVLASA